MSRTWAELRATDTATLIAEHDSKAKSTEVGTNYYLDEIHRRDADKQTAIMLRYTLWITIMTVVMMVATVINLIVFIANLPRG